MLSYCYLSTEIKGNIHNPAYYFDSNNKDRQAALDLLLLTQGWRRYVWEKADTAMLADCFLSDEIRGKQIIGKKKKRITGFRSLITLFLKVSFVLNLFVFIFTTSTMVPRYYITIFIFALPVLCFYLEEEKCPLTDWR